MVTTIEYALLAGVSYRDTRSEANRFPIPKDWGVVSIVPQDNATGFEASAYRNSVTNDIVIAYAGTYDKDITGDIFADIGLATGVGSAQLLQTAEYYLQVKAANPTATSITFTGHSLGGGLAALMGVFFGQQALTFDQAPFARSAKLNVLTPDIAANLKADLLASGHTEAELLGLTNFLQLRATSGGIPNSNLVTNINVQGEFLSGVPYNIPDRIGTTLFDINNSAPGVSGDDLHAQSLLTAFLQSKETAGLGATLNQVTGEFTDLLKMIFDKNLFANDTDTNQRNFLDHLVRHQVGVQGSFAADAMVTRFTSDLWKLAQEGGLTMTDNIPGGIFSSPPNNVSKALIAFAMQKYYDETQASAGYNKELFTAMTGGVQFDRADVAATLSDAKGYTLYFQDYLASTAFTDIERPLIQPLLPTLRDWYVQVGASGMNVTDAHNRGAFMLGGKGADALTGGNQTDLLVGNAGADTFNGKGGNDVLIGGAGFDTYIYNVGDGTDQIEDSDATGRIIYDQKLLQAGIRRTGDAVDTYSSLDGSQTYVLSGGHLIVNGLLTVNANFQSGQFGIQLRDLSSHPTDTGVPTGPFQVVSIGTNGDDVLGRATGTPGPGDAIYGLGGNDDLLGLFLGDDLLDGGAGDDFLIGYSGDDYLDGGTGNDYLDASDSINVALIYNGHDILIGGTGDDVLYSGGFIEGIGEADYLDGGDGADYLWAGRGTDVLLGGEGNDILRGDNRPGGWPTTFVGFDGFYILVPGQAIFSATGGDDFLDGGAGNDILVGDGGNDILSGGADHDQLYGDDFADDQAFYFSQPGNDILDGGAGDDLLSAGDGNDSLSGGFGIDTLFGDKGDDVLDGGGDADTLRGGDGADQLFGGTGNDLLFGDGLNNQFVAGTIGGADVLDGGDGHDELQGGVGADMLSGGIGNDFLLGQEDNDTLFGDEGADQLQGGLGNDFLVGDAGDDVLLGEAGDDTLVGGAGGDVLAGGAGADTYVFNLGDGIDTIQDTAGEGNRLVFGAGITQQDITLGIGSLLLRVGSTGDAIHIQGFDQANPSGPTGIEEFEFADGTTFTHLDLIARGFDLVGTAANDELNGGELYRGIYGLDGQDVLIGGAIDNVLDGGGGDDGLRGGIGDDLLTGGTGNDSLEGEAGDDVLEGETGDDQLLGGDGADQLDGGIGTDLLNGDAGQDTYVFGRGSGQDILQDFPVEQSGPNTVQLTSGISPNEVRLQARQSEYGVDVVLTIDGTADELTLLGAADPSLLPISQILFADGTSWDTAEILTRIEGVHLTATPAGSFLQGTEFRDELIGAQGSDDLDGRGEADRMVGGAGDDRYRVDHSGDVVVEANGEGQDTVLSQIDYTLPEHVENLLLRTTAQPVTDPVRGEGNASDNVLHGNFVNNVLVGGAGDDTFLGGFSLGSDYGPGDDDLSGGTGNDTYVVEGQFNGFDTIHDVARPGEGNRLRFGTSVRPNDIVFVQEGASLRITNVGGTDGAILADFDPSGIIGSLVTEIVAFSSGVEDVTGGYDTRLLALMNPTVGTDNAETMTGTSSAEVIKALGGDDVLIGGAGNDLLLGGTGSDIYLFTQGDGFDLIEDQPGTGDTNTVQFGPGITQDMLRVSYNGTFGIGGLSVRIGASEDGLHFLGVSAEDPTGAHAVDTFHFADGTQLTFAQLFEREVLVQGTGRSDGELFGTFANDRMNGFGGSESLSGGAGDDQLEGGTGNDVLSGGEGEDTYIFQLGDGFDRIEDDAEFIDDGQGGHLANNRILFGPEITFSDLSFVEVDLTIRKILVGSNGDGIELPNFVDFSPGLRTVSFSDGLTVDIYDLRDGGLVTDDQTIQGDPGGGVLIGGAGNDVIQSGGGHTALIGGPGNDTLVGGSGHNWISGGPGNDFLLGGSGGNTFLLSPGSNRDSIQIPNYQLLLDSSTARFSGGYGSYHPSLSLGSLVIRYGDFGDELHILDFDPNDVFARPAVQRFEFSDRVLTYEELIELGFDIEGTGSDDVLTGTNTTDRFVGLSGDDDVSGGAGTDTFTGGQGNDSLRGGAGHDTYVFNIGDGLDTIEDMAVLGEGNRIQLGTGILQTDLTFTHDEVARTLTIHVGNSGTDTLLLTNFDPTGANGSLVVETLAFANGSQVNLAALLGGSTNQAPVVANLLADQTVPEDAPFSIQVPITTFSDPDAGDTLAYSASRAEGMALPTWLSFDAAMRTFSGTPDDAQVGGLDLRVTATDTGNLSMSDVFTLTVQNVIEAPTVRDPLADQTVSEDAPFSTQVPTNAFADEDAGDVLSYSASLANGSALPSWLSFNAITRTFTGTPDDAQVGSLDLKITATDTGNLTASDVFMLTVLNVNEAPTVAATLANHTILEDAPFSLVVPANTFADQDVIHGDTLTYSATLANGAALPTWVTFNPTTRTFSGTPQGGDVGTLDVRVVATDMGNLSVADVFALTIAPSGGTAGNDTLIGTSGNDTLDGLGGDDVLQGLAGNDTLIGGAGSDLLDGGAGTDTMQGGTGNDTYVVSTGDTVVEQATQGLDTVQSDVTWTLGANLEALTLTGTANINGTGNGLDNLLTGNSGANVLTGGAGNDVYVIGAGDTMVEAANAGLDTVLSDVTTTLSANVELLVLTGTNAINGTGNNLANGITGNVTANMLNGGTGTDILAGLDGNDTYVVDHTGDLVIELANNGVDTVHSSVTYTLAVNVENLTLTGTTAINGTGNALDNFVLGNNATNVLTGVNGNDTLRGEMGNDTANGGSGNDTFLFGRGDGQDLVRDNSGTADKILYDAGISPLDLVISHHANDLRLTIHGSSDQITIQNWYVGTVNRTETIQAGNGQTLLSTQVEQLIQAMAGFTSQTGLTWDQAITQRPQDVQTVLAASWQ